MAIVGLVAVATLSEFATEVRAGSRAAEARVLLALAQDRLSALLIAPTDLLRRLPDSLAAGAFPRPFGGHRWEASVRLDRDVEGLFEARVVVRSVRGEFAHATRIFRPSTRVDRSPP
jgi:hypothetical protein